MNRTLALLAALIPILTAPLHSQRTRSIIVVPGQLTQVVSDTMGTAYEIGAPPALVFHALALAFADLKLATDLRDSAQLQVGNPQFFRRGDFAGRQISTWLSCGEGITGPYADSYRIYMSLISSVSPKEDDPGRSILRTVLLAGAVNITEGSRQAMPCESSGRLEIRLQQLTLKRLAAGL